MKQVSLLSERFLASKYAETLYQLLQMCAGDASNNT